MYKDKIAGKHCKEDSKYFIEFEKPAESWSDSFLLGDGHLGVAVYGGVKKEIIELSHNTFFSGEKQHLKRENSKKAFQNMRKSLLEKDYDKAIEHSGDFIGIRGNYGTNLPVGNIVMDFNISDDINNWDYHRKLNISEGVGNVDCKSKNFKIEKEFFVNHKDHSLYYKINSNVAIDFKICFENDYMQNNTYYQDNKYFFEIQALEKIHSDGKNGVKLKGSLSIFDCDGEVSFGNGCLNISGTTNCGIRLVTATDFDIDSDTLISSIDDEVCKTFKINYDEIIKHHIDDISSFMDRLDISFAQNDDLSEFMLQYARYLLLSSSREDSLLPASLQGVWNDNVACKIGWTCDMHLDINTQMNYWISESANLKECHKPLLNWMEKILIPSGRKTARDYYGMSGWSADLVSNAFGYTHPYWSNTISPCPTSGIWQGSDFIEHYKFSKDKEFLEKSAYPVIEEAIEFFLDYVFLNGDEYSVGPSISPENSYVVNGKRCYFMIDSTYEKVMIFELFKQYLYLCEERGKQGLYEEKVKNVLSKFSVYKIDKTGKIMEFDKEYKEYDPQHRHTSHLLGLYPYRQIVHGETKELCDAAYESIKGRLVHYENWEDTGWARSMLILYMARLKKPDLAYMHIEEMYKNLLNPNYLIIHPPTREAPSFKEVYELDGNTGVAMGIMEMLVQSRDEAIELLPTLPEKWKTGYIKGVRTYYNLEIDVEWNNKKVEKVIVKSENDQTVKFIINGAIQQVVIKKGRTQFEF